MSRARLRGPRAPQAEAKRSSGIPLRLRAAGASLWASRPSARAALAVLALASVGGLLMVLADLLTLYAVDVAGATCEDLAQPEMADACVKSGGEQHLFGVALLGLLTIVMGWGAARGSAPAAAALVACGAVALAIAVFLDLPDVYESGRIGANFEEADATPRIGFWLELAGASLALVAGTARLTRPVRRRRRR